MGISPNSIREATSFFNGLRAGGPWLLIAIHPDNGTIEAATVTAIEEAIRFLERWNGERNLYYSLNPTFRAINKKPTKKDIAAIEYICADLDPRNDETPEAAKARYKAALEAFRPEVAIIVDSGNGIQALWRLASAIPLNGNAEAKIKDAEARGKALLIALGGKSGTQNIDRILRIPGTTNLPNAVKRAAGRVECQTSLVKKMNGATCALTDFPLPSAAPPRGPGRPRTERELPQPLLDLLYLTGEEPGGRKSKSEAFWYFINSALRQGIDENKIVEACLDARFSAGSIYQHVATNGGEDYVKKQIEKALNEPETKAGEKQIIRLKDGKTDIEVRMTEGALRKRGCPVYNRDGTLVWPRWNWEDIDEDNNQVLSARLVRYNISQLADMIQHHAVVYQKYDIKQKRWRETDPPDKLVNRILTSGHVGVPDIVGVITSPIMRRDGSIITTPGYDAKTKLWYKPTSNIDLPPIGTTKADAEKALEDLKELISECAFVSDVDRSVALAAMMTVVLRAAFRVAPMFFINKPEAGTGGSYLVKIISTLALGREAVPLNLSDDPKEMVKELSAAAYEAKPILNLNNVNFDLKSSLLAQMATEGEVDIRPFGKNTETTKCDCRAITVIINGNNIKLIGELVRRALSIQLDANMECPEKRTYTQNPIEMIRRDRGKYLAAVFTIVRAFRNANLKVAVELLNDYEAWAQFVQKPLVWLGEVDPVTSQEDMRKRDPERAALRARIKAVAEHFRSQPSFTAKDIYDRAMKTTADPSGRPVVTYPDLFDAFIGQEGKLSTVGIGMKLSRDEGRVVDGESIKALYSMDGVANGYRIVSRPSAGAQKGVVLTFPSALKNAENAEKNADGNSETPKNGVEEPF
jgi:putative DNA primase/helicase